MQAISHFFYIVNRSPVTVHIYSAHSSRIRHMKSLPAAKCRISDNDSVLAPEKQQMFICFELHFVCIPFYTAHNECILDGLPLLPDQAASHILFCTRRIRCIFPDPHDSERLQLD